jgi:hypothetical protein
MVVSYWISGEPVGHKDGNDKLFRNVGKKLLLCDAWNIYKKPQISFISDRKPEITEGKSYLTDVFIKLIYGI